MMISITVRSQPSAGFCACEVGGVSFAFLVLGADFVSFFLFLDIWFPRWHVQSRSLWLLSFSTSSDHRSVISRAFFVSALSLLHNTDLPNVTSWYVFSGQMESCVLSTLDTASKSLPANHAQSSYVLFVLFCWQGTCCNWHEPGQSLPYLEQRRSGLNENKKMSPLNRRSPSHLVWKEYLCSYNKFITWASFHCGVWVPHAASVNRIFCRISHCWVLAVAGTDMAPQCCGVFATFRSAVSTFIPMRLPFLPRLLLSCNILSCTIWVQLFILRSEHIHHVIRIHRIYL